jgi:hypothetical protein
LTFSHKRCSRSYRGRLAHVLIEPGGGPDDDAETFRRLQIADDLANAQPLVAFDTARDAGVVGAGQQDEITAR